MQLNVSKTKVMVTAKQSQDISLKLSMQQAEKFPYLDKTNVKYICVMRN